jgi:hypothetical protein
LHLRNGTVKARATTVQVRYGGLMTRLLALLAVILSLVSCGVVETGAVAVSEAQSKAEEARQAQQTEARLKQQIDAAYQQAADQRKAGEAASQ